MAFHAAHRLRAATLSDAENAKLYGKCNNPLGHGHGYLTETTIGGDTMSAAERFMILSRSGKLSRSHWNRGGTGTSIWKQRISATPLQLEKILCAPSGPRSIIGSISNSLGCAYGRRRTTGSPCGGSEALGGAVERSGAAVVAPYPSLQFGVGR